MELDNIMEVDDMELDNLDFVTNLINQLEEEQRNSEVVPASFWISTLL